MAISYTGNANIQKPAANDRAWDVPLNANADLLDQMPAIGSLCVVLHEIPSTTLNVKVSAGTFRKMDGSTVTYAGSASFAVTASATSKLWLTNAGVLTAGAAFPTSGPYYPLASVVAGGTTITSIADNRPMPTVVCGSANVGNATMVAGTIAVAAPQVTASSLVFFTRKTIGGTTGNMSYTLTAGTGFTLNSSSATETSTFSWMVIEP